MTADPTDFEDYLELISERNVGRYDVPALFEKQAVLESVVADLAAPFRDESLDAVAGLDALGFVLGTGVALELGVGFLPIRKGGKLSVPDADVHRRDLTDYTGEEKTLEVDGQRVTSGHRIALVDDWIDTGAQMAAAIDLVEAAGGTVAGISVLDATDNERIRSIAAEHELHTLNPETAL
jgi:adenine phosphoribosyltransferase